MSKSEAESHEHEHEYEHEHEHEHEEDASTTADPPSPLAIDLTLAFAVAGGVTAGVLPDLAPGALASFGVLASRWRADLRFSYAFAQSARLPAPNPNVGASISLGALALDGGPLFRAGRLEIPLVAGFEAGLFDAVGENVTEGDPQHPVWLSTYLGAGLALPWANNFAVGLRVQGLVALLRPSFAVAPKPGEPQTFYRPSPVAGRAFLELELRLP